MPARSLGCGCGRKGARGCGPRRSSGSESLPALHWQPPGPLTIPGPEIPIVSKDPASLEFSLISGRPCDNWSGRPLLRLPGRALLGRNQNKGGQQFKVGPAPRGSSQRGGLGAPAGEWCGAAEHACRRDGRISPAHTPAAGRSGCLQVDARVSVDRTRHSRSPWAVEAVAGPPSSRLKPDRPRSAARRPSLRSWRESPPDRFGPSPTIGAGPCAGVVVVWRTPL